MHTQWSHCLGFPVSFCTWPKDILISQLLFISPFRSNVLSNFQTLYTSLQDGGFSKHIHPSNKKSSVSIISRCFSLSSSYTIDKSIKYYLLVFINQPTSLEKNTTLEFCFILSIRGLLSNGYYSLRLPNLSSKINFISDFPN